MFGLFAKITLSSRISRYQDKISLFVIFDAPISSRNHDRHSNDTLRVEPFWKNPRRAGDRIFRISESTNVSFDNIKVEGTYSLPNESGYAFDLRNIYNVRFKGVEAQGIWGIFGTECLNNVYVGATIMNDANKYREIRSRINRFDIHCYGRDVRIEKTDFIYDYQHSDGSKQYNQVSSIYGIFAYNDCSFTKISPLLFEDSYHVYTPFQLKMTHCRIVKFPDDKALIKAGLIGIKDDLKVLLREELQQIYMHYRIRDRREYGC